MFQEEFEKIGFLYLNSREKFGCKAINTVSNSCASAGGAKGLSH
jgi:hypothetical protein